MQELLFSAVLNPELVTTSDVNGKRKWEQSFVITEIYWPATGTVLKLLRATWPKLLFIVWTQGVLKQQLFEPFLAPAPPRRAPTGAPPALPVPAQHLLGLPAPCPGPSTPSAPRSRRAAAAPVSSSAQPCPAVAPLHRGGAQRPGLGLGLGPCPTPEPLSGPDPDPACRPASWPGLCVCAGERRGL